VIFELLLLLLLLLYRIINIYWTILVSLTTKLYCFFLGKATLVIKKRMQFLSKLTRRSSKL